MALITVPDGFPGIVGPMKAYPRGAQHLNGLADEILRGSAAELVDRVTADAARAPVSNKLKALLVIADKVQQGGRLVTDADVARAHREGADDKAIHDTVLIAAAFCMFNRYVDGPATSAPGDPHAYAAIGAKLAETGYVGSVD